MEVVLITGAIKTCKAAVKSSPPNCHQRTRRFTGRMPFLLPNQQCLSTEGKSITFHGLALTWGLPTLSVLMAPGYL